MIEVPPGRLAPDNPPPDAPPVCLALFSEDGVARATVAYPAHMPAAVARAKAANIWVEVSLDPVTGKPPSPASVSAIDAEAWIAANGPRTPPQRPTLPPPPVVDYAAQRLAEYPALADQLDALWKGGAAEAQMRSQIMGIKAQYPKPEQETP